MFPEPKIIKNPTNIKVIKPTAPKDLSLLLFLEFDALPLTRETI